MLCDCQKVHSTARTPVLVVAAAQRIGLLVSSGQKLEGKGETGETTGCRHFWVSEEAEFHGRLLQVVIEGAELGGMESCFTGAHRTLDVRYV